MLKIKLLRYKRPQNTTIMKEITRAIRKLLKKEFSVHGFKVTSEIHSGDNCINVKVNEFSLSALQSYLKEFK